MNGDNWTTTKSNKLYHFVQEVVICDAASQRVTLASLTWH